MTSVERAELRKRTQAAKDALRLMDVTDRPADFVRLVEWLEEHVVRPVCEYCGKPIRNSHHVGLGIDESPLCAVCQKEIGQ